MTFFMHFQQYKEFLFTIYFCINFFIYFVDWSYIDLCRAQAIDKKKKKKMLTYFENKIPIINNDCISTICNNIKK